MARTTAAGLQYESTEVHVDALAMAGTFAMALVVLVWSLWLSTQHGASRLWRVLSVALVPGIAVPAVLGGVLASAMLADVAHGVLFSFAAVVSIGTLIHAGRAQEA